MEKIIAIDTNIPTVSNITSSVSNGSYTTGQVIPINIEFSKNVNVTGVPQLLINVTSTTTKAINYTSGSGTNKLRFDYTVAANELINRLSYNSVNALNLNGGTIIDSANNNANLLLKIPGTLNSLSRNKNILIDTISSLVNNVTSSAADGSYISGNTIPITIFFTKSVIVTGIPQLTLETGTTDAVVNYTSGSGTNNLIFNYTISSGENTSNLNYLSTGALSLNGGTIQDSVGNNANITLPNLTAANSLGSNKSLIIDTNIPTITNVTSNKSNNTYTVGEIIDVRVVFSKIVNVPTTSIPILILNTNPNDSVQLSSGSGTNTLIFNYTVKSGQSTSNLEYTSVNALTGNILDNAGNVASLTLPNIGSGNSLGSNKNIVIDTVLPTITNVTSSSLNGIYKSGDVIPISNII